MIGRRAAGSLLGCSRRRCACDSPERSAGWSGGWSGGWWGGSPGRERPPCGVGARGAGKGAGSEHFWSRCASLLSRFCSSPDVVGRLLLVAPLVAAADDEPDEEQQEQEEEDCADDRTHDHAHLVGGCRRAGGGAGGRRTKKEAKKSGSELEFRKRIGCCGGLGLTKATTALTALYCFTSSSKKQFLCLNSAKDVQISMLN